MSKKKLTRERLRKIIREEKQKLEENEVGTMSGTVSFMARAKGDYVLTIEDSSGSTSARMSKRQVQDLLDMITIKI